MQADKLSAPFYFAASIAVAMMFRVASLHPLLDMLNPDWIALTLIYWCIALPERFGVFTAFAVGLLTDVLTGHWLGQYSLIYSLISYFSIKQYRRLRQFPLPQQCLFVGACLFLGQSLLFGMESMQAANRLPVSFWYPVGTGALIWPVVYLLLRALRQMARIS